MGNNVIVSAKPPCDLCGAEASYDARIPRQGIWANLCEKHFKSNGCRLGTGYGQQLILKEVKDGNEELQAVR